MSTSWCLCSARSLFSGNLCMLFLWFVRSQVPSCFFSEKGHCPVSFREWRQGPWFFRNVWRTFLCAYLPRPVQKLTEAWSKLQMFHYLNWQASNVSLLTLKYCRIQAHLAWNCRSNCGSRLSVQKFIVVFLNWFSFTCLCKTRFIIQKT